MKMIVTYQVRTILRKIKRMKVLDLKVMWEAYIHLVHLINNKCIQLQLGQDFTKETDNNIYIIYRIKHIIDNFDIDF